MPRTVLDRGRRPFLGAVLVLTFTSSALLHGGEAAKIAPVPSKADLARAEALVRELYKAEFTAAGKDVGARGRLAGTLLQEGRETTDDAAGRYVLLREALNLAAAAGDIPTALQAVADLSQFFTIAEADALGLKLDALARASKETSTPDAYQAVVDASLILLDEAVAADDYDAARRLAGSAEAAAVRLRSVPLVAGVRRRQQEVAALEKEYAKVKPHVEAVKGGKATAENNLEAGRYYAFVRGSWEKGLPLLARGGDAGLKKLAASDVGGPKAAPAQAALGAAWAAAGSDADGPAKVQMLLRGYQWLQQAVPYLEEGARAKVTAQMQEIMKALPPDYRVGEIVTLVRRFEGHQRPAYAVALSPDGRKAVSGGGDTSVRVWDTRTGKEIRRLDGSGDTVWSVGFSPDGRRVLSAGFDNSVRLWDLASGRDVRRFTGHDDYVRSATFTPSGRSVLSGGDDRTLRLWDAETGKELRTLRGHEHFVMSVAVSPDGKHAASGSLDKTVRVWDLETASELRRLDGHRDTVLGVAFSPDGRRILSGSSDGTLKLWDAQSGTDLKTLKGHRGYVLGVAFAPDGLRALSSGSDGTVRLWDLGTGQELRSLEGHTGRVWSVAFSRDGRLAVSGGDDGTVRLWGPAR